MRFDVFYCILSIIYLVVKNFINYFTLRSYQDNPKSFLLCPE
jgi:hypothetical protein